MEESLGWAAAAAAEKSNSSEEPLLLYYSGKGKSSEQLNFIAIAKCFHVIGHMLDVWMSLCAPSWYLENLLAWNIIIGVCGGWSGTALPGSLYS